jgi:hypothetical protein
MEVSGQLHAPAAVPTRLGERQCRSGFCGQEEIYWPCRKLNRLPAPSWEIYWPIFYMHFLSFPFLCTCRSAVHSNLLHFSILILLAEHAALVGSDEQWIHFSVRACTRREQLRTELWVGRWRSSAASRNITWGHGLDMAHCQLLWIW